MKPLSMTWLAIIVVGWLAIGLGLAGVLGRRGHDRGTWLVSGALLGPLAIVNAWRAVQEGEALAREPIAAPPADVEGDTHVVVGYDGSAAAEAALRTAVELFGSQLGRVVVVTVVPFDCGLEEIRDAHAALEALGSRFAWLAPGLEVVHGRPAAALAEVAASDGASAIAVGVTGAGRALRFGSVAEELATTADLPVVLAASTITTAR